MWYDPIIRFWEKEKDAVDWYSLLGQAGVYTFLIMILLWLLTGCASTSNLNRNAITLPEPPPKISIREKNEKEPNTVYVEKPTILKPQQTYRSDKGGVVWSYQDQNTIDWGLREQRRWIDTTRDIVGSHNQEKPWWAFWR